MELKKQLFIIILILIVASSFLTFDWTRFFTGTMTNIKDSNYPRESKWLISLLCFFLVWMSGKNAWNSDDEKRLRLIFVCILLADTFLVLLSKFDNPVFTGIGILIFFCAHILLIIRNTHGLKNLFSRWNIISAVIIAAATTLVLTSILYPILKNEILLFIFGILYLLILSASLWAGWASLNIGYIPTTNCVKIAIGLTCFYLCDISVIFNLATGSPKAMAPKLLFTILTYPAWEGIRYIVHNIVWMFYIPALFLLALSGYKTKLICYLEDGEK
ncbi:MAG: hypothetical protein JXJ04_18885 [Spirochaetales bacterium]|nr:hypothetical protein [Spirochaetales bacterium]